MKACVVVTHPFKNSFFLRVGSKNSVIFSHSFCVVSLRTPLFFLCSGSSVKVFEGSITVARVKVIL